MNVSAPALALMVALAAGCNRVVSPGDAPTLSRCNRVVSLSISHGRDVLSHHALDAASCSLSRYFEETQSHNVLDFETKFHCV